MSYQTLIAKNGDVIPFTKMEVVRIVKQYFDATGTQVSGIVKLARELFSCFDGTPQVSELEVITRVVAELKSRGYADAEIVLLSKYAQPVPTWEGSLYSFSVGNVDFNRAYKNPSKTYLSIVLSVNFCTEYVLVKIQDFTPNNEPFWVPIPYNMPIWVLDRRPFEVEIVSEADTPEKLSNDRWAMVKFTGYAGVV